MFYTNHCAPRFFLGSIADLVYNPVMSSTKSCVVSAQKIRGSSLTTPDAIDWVRVGAELRDRFSKAPIHLIPATSGPTVAEIERRFPDARRIFAVDFYLEGAERGELLPCGSGYRVGSRGFNIDHHAPDPRWERHVSSGVLACKWVRANGAVGLKGGDVVVINHTDCDSVLSSLILSGVLPPHERFERAVVDADHRGAPNDLADILQACSTTRDLQLLIEGLSRFLSGEPLSARVESHLDQLHEKRMAVREIAQRGAHEHRNGVVFIDSDRYLDSDLFLPHFPQARLLVIGCPSEKYPEFAMTRLRLGGSVEEGVSLHRLGVTDFDPYFGGRFNAGSNKRGVEAALASGQTPRIVSPKEHFERLANLFSVAR